MKKRILVLLSVVVLMLAMAVPAFAAPGDHGSSIGRDASSTNQLGKAVGNPGAGGDVVSGVAQDGGVCAAVGNCPTSTS
jgi:hypothetical protein